MPLQAARQNPAGWKIDANDIPADEDGMIIPRAHAAEIVKI
jgi:hypothetical protein